MSFEKLVRKSFAEPWAILPDQLAALVEKLWELKADYIDDLYGIQREKYQPRLVNENGLGVIRMAGAIGKGLAGWELMLGQLDCDDVQQLLRRAADDKMIKAVFLDCDSPGGTMNGVPELAEEVVRLRGIKPVLSYTDTMMCSAMYYISAGSTAIYSAASVLVGSIGVLRPMLDVTKYYEALGVKRELFVSGPLKGAGYPGTTLSAEQREYMQAIVSDSFADFKAHVLAHRPGVAADAFKGGVFHGKAAMAAGLVDSLCDRETAKRDALALA